MKTFSIACLFLLLAGTVFAAVESNYRIGAGDVLRIAVYDHPDLATTARVNSDGTILFPLVGSVVAGGRTVGNLADALARLLSDGYLVNPQVSIFVEEFRSQKATIVGQVRTPGLYELSGPTTLRQLISKAGGLTPEAAETITVQRPSAQGGEEKIAVPVRALMAGGDNAQDIAILDGDSIFVDRAGRFYVTGEVRKPDAYQYEQGMSVITAITRAGGFTDLAAKGKVRVIRKSGEKEEVIEKAPMHTPIQPDDVIVVPESFF